eukprot:COSAG06_NODE_2716_length_6401_cov_2.369883_3_plen_90_part_00
MKQVFGAQHNVDQGVKLAACVLLDDGGAPSCISARAGVDQGVGAAACISARAVLGRCAREDADENSRLHHRVGVWDRGLGFNRCGFNRG